MLGDCPRHAERSELWLDERWVVADFEHGHRELVGSSEGIEIDRGGLPFVVQSLEIVGQSSEVAVGHIRNTAAHCEASLGELVCQAEHDAALQRLGKRRRPTGPETQSHRGSRRNEVECEAFRMLLEPSSETPEQPCCGRAEHAEPERFDVARSRIVSVVVDERINPLANVDSTSLDPVAGR